MCYPFCSHFSKLGVGPLECEPRSRMWSHLQCHSHSANMEHQTHGPPSGPSLSQLPATENLAPLRSPGSLGHILDIPELAPPGMNVSARSPVTTAAILPSVPVS